MPFTPPNFNMLCDQYTLVAAGGPPWLVLGVQNIPCQLYPAPRSWDKSMTGALLRIPSATVFPVSVKVYDLVTGDNMAFFITSAPFGALFPDMYWWLNAAVIEHAGFPNEYRSLSVQPIYGSQWPVVSTQWDA